ncbi:hypothetical protein [Niveibacterium sp.]|uniref:hypothetical protein n=1 Tax=Niveibacterium sp. TaxID=2017444 RepID=UPI0035AF0AD0
MSKNVPHHQSDAHLPGQPLYSGRATAEEIETLRLANLRLERLSIKLLVGFFVWSLLFQGEWVAPGSLLGSLLRWIPEVIPSITILAKASTSPELVIGVTSSSWIFVALSLAIIVFGDQLPTRAAVAHRNLGWTNLLFLTLMVVMASLLSTAFFVWLPIGPIDFSHLPTKGDVMLALTLRSRFLLAVSTTAISAFLLFFYYLSIGLAFSSLSVLVCRARSNIAHSTRRNS